MLEEEIKTKLSEKREYDLYLFMEVLKVYLDLLLCSNSKDKRALLMIFFSDNVLYSKLEREILKEIKKQKYNEKNLEICEDMIERMDKIFFNLFNYNEWILEGFIEAIETGEFIRAAVPAKEFEVLNDTSKKQFVKELKKNRN